MEKLKRIWYLSSNRQQSRKSPSFSMMSCRRYNVIKYIFFSTWHHHRHHDENEFYHFYNHKHPLYLYNNWKLEAFRRWDVRMTSTWADDDATIRVVHSRITWKWDGKIKLKMTRKTDIKWMGQSETMLHSVFVEKKKAWNYTKWETETSFHVHLRDAIPISLWMSCCDIIAFFPAFRSSFVLVFQVIHSVGLRAICQISKLKRQFSQVFHSN